ncbi:MAG: metal ABC transporter permease, partial [Phycisphaerales bacterium]|nr:metal ABC transporter permease [Phycisphaerales bacterium]
MILAQLSSSTDTSFWREALETLTLRAGYNTTVVVLGTTLLGVAAGLVGSFLLLRKRSLVADALSHATLPGVAIAFLIADAIGNGLSAKSLPVLLLGAAITGVLAVLTIQLIVRHTRLREDAAIGLTLSVFFGAGVVLLRAAPDYASTPASGLHHFIYGQTAGLLITDVYLMGAIALIAILAAAFLFKELALTCFNDDFARATGWPVSILDIALMALVVLVVVAGL